MMRLQKSAIVALILIALTSPVMAKSARIGYLATYTPWIAAIADGSFERATGYEIKWLRFNTGAEIVNALRNDVIDIGSAGSAPIAAALSLQHRIQLFWILQDINFAEGLVARDGTGIIEPQDLRGKRIATPFASTSHYHLLFALRQFQIKKNEIKLSHQTPVQILENWKRGDIDAAFVWNPALDTILRSGKLMISSGRLSRWGKPTFDGLIVNEPWAKQNDDFLTGFVKAISEQDQDFRERPRAWSQMSENVRNVVKMLGGTRFSTAKSLRLYGHPTIQSQASPKWLGGGEKSLAAKALKDTAEFLKANKIISSTLSNYSRAINSRWIERAMAK